MNETPLQSATAQIPFPAPEAALARMHDALVQLGLSAAGRTSAGTLFRFDGCEIALDHDDVCVLVTLAAPDARRLQQLRDGTLRRLAEMDPDAAARLTWSTAEHVGSRPPGFRKLTFLRKGTLFPGMVRYTFSGEDLGAYWDEPLHLRMMIPPQDSEAPEWPVIGENGATRLPDGENALAVRTYTVRRVRTDGSANEIDIDVLEHGEHAFGGWARRAKNGDVIGAIGPAGGLAPPTGHWLLLGGDLSALPALARICEAQADARGVCIVAVPPGADNDVRTYLNPPSGIAFHALQQDQDPLRLVDAFKSVEPPPGETVCAWFAAESAQARLVRTYLRSEAPFPLAHRYAAAYWHRPA